MYAKWIHPKKIVMHEGNILRHNGRITVNPTHEDYLLAEFFPVVLGEGQSVSDRDNIYIVRENRIIILGKENL